MKVPTLSAIAILALFALPFFAPQATAQSRPDCLLDPTKPGACFTETEPFEVYLFCDDGLLVWADVGTGENDFYRTNPDGTIFAHYSDRDLGVGYCTPEVLAMGLCFPGSPEIFYGILDFQANGLFFSPGFAGCPFLIQSRGEVWRPSDGQTLWLAPKLVAVQDPKTPWYVCRIQTCRILAPGNKNAEDDSE